jgi:hypothetical protein
LVARVDDIDGVLDKLVDDQGNFIYPDDAAAAARSRTPSRTATSEDLTGGHRRRHLTAIDSMELT